MGDERHMLARFLRTGDSEDFEPIVSQYINLVYSTALRVVPQQKALAEDICQTVFADLSRKAARISHETPLAGWLYRHTCFVAANLNRSERRRLERERQAVEMNANEHADEKVPNEDLHLAMGELSDGDRDALVLRFMDERDLRGVGERLGISEDAAQKRVSRALERLRQILQRRGISATVAGLTVSLGQQVMAAPTAVTAKTLAAVTAAGGSVGILPFAFEFMKTPIAKVASILLIGGGVAATIHQQGRLLDESRQKNAKLQSRLAAAEMAGRERGGSLKPIADAREIERLREHAREVHRLRAALSALRAASVQKQGTTPTKADVQPQQEEIASGPPVYQIACKLIGLGKQTKGAIRLDSFMDSLELPGGSSASGVLVEPIVHHFLNRVQQTPGIDVLSAPRVITRAGEPAQVEVGQNIEVIIGYRPANNAAGREAVTTNLMVGPVINLEANPGSAGDSIDLSVKFAMTTFDGYVEGVPGAEDVPIIDATHVATRAILVPGQTLLLCAHSEIKDTPYLVLITPSVVGQSKVAELTRPPTGQSSESQANVESRLRAAPPMAPVAAN